MEDDFLLNDLGIKLTLSFETGSVNVFWMTNKKQIPSIFAPWQKIYLL